MTGYFPPFIGALPRPDSPVRMEAHIVPGGHVLPMFYEIEEDFEIPEHSHGAQWGVVLEGEFELVIEGSARVLKRGDVYYVPAGARHIARIKAGYKGIDVFEDPDRYVPLATRGAPTETGP